MKKSLIIGTAILIVYIIIHVPVYNYQIYVNPYTGESVFQRKYMTGYTDHIHKKDILHEGLIKSMLYDDINFFIKIGQGKRYILGNALCGTTRGSYGISKFTDMVYECVYKYDEKYKMLAEEYRDYLLRENDIWIFTGNCFYRTDAGSAGG